MNLISWLKNVWRKLVGGDNLLAFNRWTVDEDVIVDAWYTTYDAGTNRVRIHIVGRGFGGTTCRVLVSETTSRHRRKITGPVTWSDTYIIVEAPVIPNQSNANTIIQYTNLTIYLSGYRLPTISDSVKNNTVGNRGTKVSRPITWTVTDFETEDGQLKINGTRLERVETIIFIGEDEARYAADFDSEAEQLTVDPPQDVELSDLESAILLAQRGTSLDQLSTIAGPFETISGLSITSTSSDANGQITINGTGFTTIYPDGTADNLYLSFTDPSEGAVQGQYYRPGGQGEIAGGDPPLYASVISWTDTTIVLYDLFMAGGTVTSIDFWDYDFSWNLGNGYQIDIADRLIDGTDLPYGRQVGLVSSAAINANPGQIVLTGQGFLNHPSGREVDYLSVLDDDTGEWYFDQNGDTFYTAGQEILSMTDTEIVIEFAGMSGETIVAVDGWWPSDPGPGWWGTGPDTGLPLVIP